MEKYENMGLVGEGSYGMVLKCKHKESGQLVAIKKFLESEDDKMVKKIAMREVRMLKQLRHDHLVNLLEVFRRKKRLYLVFEFVDHTVLDELEKCPNGLDETTTKKILWQVLKGTEFCHLNNIIHRDIKPENILVSRSGVVKLCDFGFARTLAQPGEIYTDYVATRWYRAPELLVGDTKYGRAVDIWAVGCLLAEMLTGEPLFPGDSDIDQLYHIVKVFGNLTARHKEVFLRNPLFVGMRLPEVRETTPLDKKFTRISNFSLELMKECLKLDPDVRPTCSQLLKHDFFTRDGFAAKFAHDLKAKIQREHQNNPLITSLGQDDNDKEESSNNKTTTKKKKKVLAPAKKESKADSESKESKDHGKGGNKESGGKSIMKKDDLKENTSEEKNKRKVAESPDKMNKTSPPTSNHNISLPPANSQSRQSQNKSVSGENVKQDKLDKHDKNDKTDKHEKLDKMLKDGDRDTKLKQEIANDKHHEKEKVERNSDKDVSSRSDSKLDSKDRLESKQEVSKEKGDILRDKEKLDKQDDVRDKENYVSLKDSSSIPPIHNTGPNSHSNSSNITPSIPSITSPNTVMHSSPLLAPVNSMTSPRGAPYTGPLPHRKHTSSFPDGNSPYALMVNEKMKKTSNYKKNPPNHHSMALSPQPLQSEKSLLHDKSLEKLRSKIREGTLIDRREKELISLPEVRGAEANPVKIKSKLSIAQRSNVATIPHITNIDPFPSNSQMEAHSSEKNENLPSV